MKILLAILCLAAFSGMVIAEERVIDNDKLQGAIAQPNPGDKANNTSNDESSDKEQKNADPNSGEAGTKQNEYSVPLYDNGSEGFSIGDD